MSQTRIPLAQLDSSIGAGGAGTWGSITGTLSAQTDLQAALNGKLDSDATLTALAGQNWALNSVPVGSGADTVSQLALTTNTVLGRSSSGNAAAKPVTDLGYTLINNATTLSMQTTIGVVPGGTYAGQSLKVLRVNTAETALELATLSGLGTVTNTGGVLTSNAVILGNGSADVKVVAGITTDGVSQINLGVNATTLGKLKLFGNTSGDVTLQPNAVAGTGIVLTLPATTGALVTGGGTASGTNTGDQTSVTGNAGTATALQNARTIGGVSFDGTANITVATATGGFTVSGGNLALGTNSLTLTGSIASTGSRVTKGWFTDLETTNAMAGSITGNAATATALATSRNIWGQAFTGAADVTGSLTGVDDITGGESSMVITAGTGNSRSIILRTTTSGGVATPVLSMDSAQNAAFAERSSAKSLAVTGTAGAGFAELVPQSSAPTAPATGLRAYADSTGRFAWIRASDGFTRTFDATLTGNRVYTLPDATGTIAMEGLAGTKIYWVSDSSGGAVNRKLTFVNGILTLET